MNVSSEPQPVVECGGYHFFCRNRDEFERICQDVFDGHEYRFEARRRAPFIIDAGAHVGVATHYFKQRYPRSRVLALEANPVTVDLLRRNVSHNGLDDVRVLHAALAPQAGEITFYASASDEEPGAWGDSVIQQPWHEGEATEAVRVPAVTLSSLLTEPIDLLKLDIEGLETAVLAEAAPRLWLVQCVILEFHGTRRNPDNSIVTLTENLREAGFTPEVRQFGEVVGLSAIQRDEPYWLAVRADRLNPWQRVRRQWDASASTAVRRLRHALTPLTPRSRLRRERGERERSFQERRLSSPGFRVRRSFRGTCRRSCTR